MRRGENLIKQGIVKEVLSNASFMIELENGDMIKAHISGKMRQNYIKISEGDKVNVEISPYDDTKGRITRHKY